MYSCVCTVAMAVAITVIMAVATTVITTVIMAVIVNNHFLSMYYMIKKFFSIGIEPITWGDLLLRHCLQSPALPNELTEELV